MFVEYGMVWQVGQCIEMGEVGDLFFDVVVFGDVFMCGYLVVVCKWFVQDLDGMVVGGVDYYGIVQMDVFENEGGVGVDVVVE